MYYEITYQGKQKHINGKHTKSDKERYVYIDGLDQEIFVRTNPRARELVTYKIEGVTPPSDLRRFVVAIRNGEKLVRLPTSYNSKVEAVKVCKIMSELFDESLVLHVNASVPKPYTEEDDPENWARDHGEEADPENWERDNCGG